MLNGAHQDIIINMLRYRQIDRKSGAIIFEADWITDLELTYKSVGDIAAGRRARWKIEKETLILRT